MTLDSIQIDSQSVSFTGQHVKTVSFSNEFASAPKVIVTSDGPVNIWTSDISTSAVTVHLSSGWVGSVYLQAIGVKK